jgi:uncharacterized glyoxalase superfamily protein PhnB
MKPSDDNFKILPTLQYRDSARAIEWLCRAFGFRPQLLVPDDERGAMVEAGHYSAQSHANVKAIDVSSLDTSLLDAVVRLVRLLDTPLKLQY